MQRRATTLAAITAGLFIAALGVATLRNRDYRAAIEKTHGIRLPVSSSDFEVRGDSYLRFFDWGASCAFIIDRKELDGFTKALPVREMLPTFIPGNSQYALKVSWRRGRPAATYGFSSSVGDWLHVEVWPIDQNRVGICLYTDWN